MFSLKRTLDEHHKLISITLSVLAAVLLVVGVTSATTISTNVSTAALTATGATTFNGVAYTWPAADGTSGQFLTTDSSGTLSWSTASPSSGGGWTDDGTVVRLTGITDNVGIGTTTLTQKLGVHGDGLFAGNVSLAGLVATSTITTSGSATSTWASSGLSVAGGGLVSSAGLTLSGGDILHTGATFRLTSDGKLGVGTTSPWHELGVAGDIILGSSATTTLFVTTDTANKGGCIELTGADGATIFRIYATTTGPLIAEAGSCQ